MKKTLVALALASAFSATYAQSRGPEADESVLSGPSRVELYGIVDGGLEYYNFGDKSVSRLASGMSAGSRWGLRGSENLGNGWRALFVLESRFSIDTGSVTNNNSVFSCGTGTYIPGVLSGTACAGPNGASKLPLVPGAALATGLPLPNGAPGVIPGTNLIATQLLLNTTNAALLDIASNINGAGALFDRQAFVGLVTPVGAIALGRQYTPGYEVLNKFNAFADQTAGQMGQLYSTLKIRANNAVQYRAELKGFTLSAMYGFGGAELVRNERGTTPTNGDDYYGANFQYANDTFSVGVGYNHDNVVPYLTTQKKTGLETLNVGGTYNVGPVKLFAQYMKRKNDNPIVSAATIQNILASVGVAGASGALANLAATVQFNPYDIDTMRGVVGKTDTNVYHLGMNWRVGPGTLIAAWNHAKDTARSVWQTEDAKANHLAAAYFYDFSKRTQLYGAYAIMMNDGPARMGLASAGYTNGYATSQGVNTYAVQAGLRHAF